jgi:SAM-dependent methyltransferase
MTLDEATDFIRPAVAGRAGDWMDLGAGSGTFTAALARLLGAPHTVTAVERDTAALKQLQQLAATSSATTSTIRVIDADLADPTSFDAILEGSQAGVLFGNVLHYFADPLPLLRAARTRLNASGVVTVLEYEGARANAWVPHPLPLRRLRELADAAQLEAPDVVSETTSRYQGTLYCAVLSR